MFVHYALKKNGVGNQVYVTVSVWRLETWSSVCQSTLQGGGREYNRLPSFIFIEAKNGVVHVVKVNVRYFGLDKCPNSPIKVRC